MLKKLIAWLVSFFKTEEQKLQRKYAWLPDVPDHRDQIYAPAPAVAAKLPDHVDQLGLGNPIEDQGQLGSCTGNSSTSMVEIILKTGQLSRLMAYYDGRIPEGTTKQDAGALIRDVVKGISKYGVASEALWPYNVKKFATKPSAAAYRDGLKLPPLIASYQRVTSLADLKAALAIGHPVVFGFSVPDYFESDAVAASGWVRLPTAKDAMIGGHAVVAVGYDDRPSKLYPPFVWVRNSWGASWGLNGYFKMDQTWFTDKRGLVDDMWTIVKK